MCVSLQLHAMPQGHSENRGSPSLSSRCPERFSEAMEMMAVFVCVCVRQAGFGPSCSVGPYQ